MVAKEGRAYGKFFDGLNINVNSSHDLLKASFLYKSLSESKINFELHEAVAKIPVEATVKTPPIST